MSQAAWEFKSPWNEPKYLKQVQGYITYVTPNRNTRVKSEKIVTKFGESLNLVMFSVNILVKKLSESPNSVRFFWVILVTY